MNYDMTFCVNENCKRDCLRKYNELDFERGITISVSDFGKYPNGDQIDYNKCEGFIGENNNLA